MTQPSTSSRLRLCLIMPPGCTGTVLPTWDNPPCTQQPVYMSLFEIKSSHKFFPRSKRFHKKGPLHSIVNMEKGSQHFYRLCNCIRKQFIKKRRIPSAFYRLGLLYLFLNFPNIKHIASLYNRSTAYLAGINVCY